MSFRSHRAYDSRITVYDEFGRFALAQDIEVVAGKNRVRLTTAGLPSGMYYVVVNKLNRRVSVRIIVR